MTEVYTSASAQRRMQQRGVEFKEVEFAVLYPELTWKNQSVSGKTYEVRQCGDIGVVVKRIQEGWLVISVLWRHQEQWTDGEMFITRMIYDEGRRKPAPKKNRR